MFRATIALSLLLLTGCQNLTPGVATGYHGNEQLPEFFRVYHNKHQSSGAEFRGFRKVRRHYF